MRVGDGNLIEVLDEARGHCSGGDGKKVWLLRWYVKGRYFAEPYKNLKTYGRG
jgi:hypothetical protein